MLDLPEDFHEKVRKYLENLRKQEIEQLKKEKIILLQVPSEESLRLHPYIIFSKN